MPATLSSTADLRQQLQKTSTIVDVLPSTLSSSTDLRQQLQVVEAYLARLTEHLRRVEGERDSLIRQLGDHEGCHDQRFAVR